MLDVLPIELRYNIAEAAARLLVYEDRPLVVQLALLSRSVAHVVRPILYQWVVITQSNLHYFVSPGPCDEVLKLACRLSIFTQPDESHLQAMAKDKVLTVLERWKPPPGGGHLNIPWNYLRKAFKTPLGEEISLSGIDIRFIDIIGALDGYKRMPPKIAERLTHITGYIPSHWTALDAARDDSNSPRGWARLIGALPALTHLGLYLVDVNERVSPVDSDDDSKEDLEVIREMLYTLRQFSQSLQVCIRVGGIYLKRRTAVEQVIGSLVDPRLVVWYDTQPIYEWDEEEAREIEDAWRGRTVWASVPPSASGQARIGNS